MSRSASKDWKAIAAKSVSLPEEIEPGDEIWIFEAPADFDVAKLEGKKVNIAEGQVIESSENFSKQLLVDDYRSLSCKPERVVLPERPNNSKWRYAAPVGRISVIDYLDHVHTEQVPSAVIARCPKLPTGLKRRYRPFGLVDTSRTKGGRVQKLSTKSPKHKGQKHGAKS